MPTRGPRYRPSLEALDQNSVVLQFSEQTPSSPGVEMESVETSDNKYSVILPTYNERKNLPISCWLLERTFREK
jgi:dolichol-phosphate mannosyltransferase